jgi:hypothetical protein
VPKVSAREVFDQIFFALSTNSVPTDRCLAGSQFYQLNAQAIEALPIRYLGLNGQSRCSIARPIRPRKKPLGLVTFDARPAARCRA